MVKKLKLKEALLKLVQEKEKTLESSHSKREPLKFLNFKISSFKRRAKMLWKSLRHQNHLLLLLNPKLEELKARRRLLQNQLLKIRRLLSRSQLKVLKSERVLTRSWNTLQANQQERKKLLQRQLLNQLLRNQQLEERNKPQQCHHQVERNQPRPLIKWQWLNSRNTATGMRKRRGARPAQVERFSEREVKLGKLQLHQERHQRLQRNPRNE